MTSIAEPTGSDNATTQQSPLARAAARGAAVTMSGRVLRIGLQLTGVAVLARVLAPSDFGVVAMVLAIIGVGELIREFGLSNAAVQAQHLSRQQRDNLFWMSTGLGTIVALIVALAAPAIGGLYGRPEIIDVTRALSLTFVLNGMTAQYRASLARDLRFLSLQMTDLAPAAVGIAAAAAFALADWGYWALVAQQWAQATFGLVVSVCCCRWLPRLPRRVDGMGSFVRYGSSYLASQILSFGTKNAHSIVLGMRFAPSSVGLYSRGYELVVNSTNQIIMPASRVSVAVLSKLQNDPGRYESFLLSGQRVLLHLVLPLLGLGAALAHPVVEIVLGPGWDGTASIMQILCVAAAINACVYALQWFALSKAHTGIDLRINLTIAPIWIGFIVLGSEFGVSGVATGFAVGQVLHWVTSLIWFRRSVGAPSWKLFVTAVRAILPNAVAAALTYVMTTNALLLEGWVAVGAGAPIYFVALALGVVGVRSVREDVRDALEIRRYLRGAGSSSSQDHAQDA